MANATGGLPLLGIHEGSGDFAVTGVMDPAQVAKDLKACVWEWSRRPAPDDRATCGRVIGGHSASTKVRTAGWLTRTST